MPSNAVVDLTLRAEPDELPEWMDEPCSYEDFRHCLLDLAQVNSLTLAARPTLDFLERLCRQQPGLSQSARKNGAPDSVQPLRIVDVGCGGGDMLRRIERWAKQRDLPVKLVGIDLNPYAARAAREFTRGSEIEWLTGDAFSYAEPIDVVLSSLFTHHLSTSEIVGFLAWSERVARRGWFINDLCREAVPYRLFGPLARVMRWHRFVQHDGPVSFRRSFREADWQQMLAAAGVAADAVTLKRWTPARLCVGRIRRPLS
jgi:SAM-dependent methyltransferase